MTFKLGDKLRIVVAPWRYSVGEVGETTGIRNYGNRNDYDVKFPDGSKMVVTDWHKAVSNNIGIVFELEKREEEKEV